MRVNPEYLEAVAEENFDADVEKFEEEHDDIQIILKEIKALRDKVENMADSDHWEPYMKDAIEAVAGSLVDAYYDADKETSQAYKEGKKDYEMRWSCGDYTVTEQDVYDE